jgi:hypothetical protein
MTTQGHSLAPDDLAFDLADGEPHIRVNANNPNPGAAWVFYATLTIGILDCPDGGGFLVPLISGTGVLQPSPEWREAFEARQGCRVHFADGNTAWAAAIT